jgi:hypothetical protein
MQLWVLRLSVTVLTTFWTGRLYANGFEVNHTISELVGARRYQVDK